jgi:hypothetical protein
LAQKVDLVFAFSSDVEREIQKGVAENLNNFDNTLYFEREIEDLKENICCNTGLAAKYIDLDDAGQIDKEAQLLLEEMKTKKVQSQLPLSNIFKYRVRV